mgnify:CR=1 FL=1
MFYSIFKNILIVISFLLFLTTLSSSEISSKAWSKQCSEDKSACVIAIINEIKLENKNEQTLATAYIQIGSSKQKKMNLINEEDQTYKLSEENKNIPVLFVKLPLNADLTRKPAIVIDKKKLGDLNFTHCNQNDGCVTNVAISNHVIDLFMNKAFSILEYTFQDNKDEFSPSQRTTFEEFIRKYNSQDKATIRTLRRNIDILLLNGC